ncbi:transmembrane protein 42 [Apis mellifera caucasica]|uniref:Transmembrane protein 42 n=1 Tax=Apis mellifera TaxID=7460 RepID=A0A7M7LQ23_APIME|nr:transmembrane protein 42 [Apis mellifera]KAG6795388.1 transmembrane protein 42 [Apis mellifera caucasica]|eukprot:XP_006571635.1 transmembrane protein 42 [Apis mellifera]
MFIMKRKCLMDTFSLSSRESQSVSCIKEKKQGKIYLAVISGFFATTGSILGKLSSNIEINSIFELLLKGILLLLMITSNTVGCTFFVKALNISKSSLSCTITSATTSYVCSAFAGFLIFNEQTSLNWWCGISLIILGLFFVNYNPQSDSVPSLKSKNK